MVIRHLRPLSSPPTPKPLRLLTHRPRSPLPRPNPQSLRPEPEDLARLDGTTPKVRFIAEGGFTVGPNKTPVLRVKITGTVNLLSQHPEDDLGAGATVKTKNEKVKSGREVYEEAKSQVKRMTEMGGSCARAVETHNFIKFSPYSAITKGQHHVFTVTFGQMQTNMRLP